MAFPDNGGASSGGGDDASNRLIDRAPTQQVAEHLDQTTQEGVGDSDRLSGIHPTQEEFFASDAEDIIREFANRDQPTISHDAINMPWLVRVQTQIEYVYVAPDEAAGASLGQDEVRVEELSDFEDDIEPQAPVAEQAPQPPNGGTDRGAYRPQHPDANGSTLPANVDAPFGLLQPVSTEPAEFGNVGNPYDDYRTRRMSQPVGNQNPVGAPPFNLGSQSIFTGPSGRARPHVPPYQAHDRWTENRADLPTMIPGIDDGLSAYPCPQGPRSRRPSVGDPAQTTRLPTSYDTLTTAGARSGTLHAPGSTNNSINNARTVGQQAHRRPPFVHNPNNPPAQIMPVDASGNPVRPSTTRLPPRLGPLGLGTVGHRIRREDIQQEDPADDEDAESGNRQPQQRRPRHRAPATIQPVGPDDDDTDDEETKPHRTKRQRRTSTFEGNEGKKKYEKRPGVVRREGPTENLQVFDPKRKQWRDAVYHPTIRAILLQNAGPTSQYRLRGEPGYMMHNDRVVIDRENHPIRDWPLIPATLSTKFEGGYMEAIRRLCAGIRLYDFWARMPAENNDHASIGATGLGNRTERFRNENGLAPWRPLSGGTELRDAIRAKMSQADRDANSTRNFVRLTAAELAAAKAKNKESAATKAKSRTHQARIAKQKPARETQEVQSQEHDEQYEAEEDNAGDSFAAEDKNQSAEDDGDGDE